MIGTIQPTSEPGLPGSMILSSALEGPMSGAGRPFECAVGRKGERLQLAATRPPLLRFPAIREEPFCPARTLTVDLIVTNTPPQRG